MLHTMCWPTSVIEIFGRGALVASTRRTHTFRRAMVSKAFSHKAINGKQQTAQFIKVSQS